MRPQENKCISVFKGVVDYWLRKIVSFFDAKLLWYQTIVIVVLLTIYCGHVCEYLQKKSSECLKLSKLLIVENTPVRRAAAGGVHRFRWTNHLKAKCFEVIILYTNIYSVETCRWIWTKIVEVTHESIFFHIFTGKTRL